MLCVCIHVFQALPAAASHASELDLPESQKNCNSVRKLATRIVHMSTRSGDKPPRCISRASAHGIWKRQAIEKKISRQRAGFTHWRCVSSKVRRNSKEDERSKNEQEHMLAPQTRATGTTLPRTHTHATQHRISSISRLDSLPEPPINVCEYGSVQTRQVCETIFDDNVKTMFAANAAHIFLLLLMCKCEKAS